MGNGKKNKPGAQPKKKGRLVAALAKSQTAALLRAKLSAAEIAKEERAKASASGATQAQMKKKRKLERAAEREKEREEEAEREKKALANAGTAVVEGEEGVVGEEAGEGKGKRKREERDRKKGTIPYKMGQKILLIGEGNFSFAHALLLIQPPTVTPHLLLATSFDSLEVAIGKYPDLMLHVDAIREMGAKVVFSVDATDLKKCREVKEGREWDKVAFNFPHVGAGITDQDRNIRANQTLILRFLRSVTPFLRKGASASTDQQNPIKKSNKLTNWTSKKTAPKRPRANSDDEDDLWAATAAQASTATVSELEREEEEEEEEDPDEIDLTLNRLPPTTAGTVLITLRTAAPYSLWSLAHLGTRGSLIAPSILPRPLPTTPQPNFKIVRSFEFSTFDYPTYEHRRTIGFKEGVSSGKNEDLNLSARERGEKRREEKERGEKEEKEEREERGKGNGKEGRGIMRTWEMESAEKTQEELDDLYD